MLPRLVAGNWKMYGGPDALARLDEILDGIDSNAPEVLICPPATLIPAFANRAAAYRLSIGAQDCHPRESGAHTGDLAAEMLRDAGASHVIVGHSERRADHGESDSLVSAKARAAWRAGLTAIICIGESEDARNRGEAVAVVSAQCQSIPDGANSANTAVAYEPIWAIGTGRTPSLTEIAEIHAMLRKQLAERFDGTGTAIRLLYGGSVKPTNAREIFSVPEVNGALVGGASLRATDFLPIVRAAM